jgi:excisionase family DNA binding protein
MAGNSNDGSLVLTPSEVRKLLGCSRGVVYEGIRRGIIPSIRISPRKIIIPRQRFFEWLNGGGGDNLHPKE